MRLYCYHINFYMPEEIFNIGNNAFNIFKNNYSSYNSISKHCRNRMQERGIDIGNINDYNLCEVYLKGRKLETFGIYKKDKKSDLIIVLYVSGINLIIKTAIVLNKYSFKNSSRRIKFSTELPIWMIEEFKHELKSKNNNSKNIDDLRQKLISINKLIDLKFEHIMINYKDIQLDQISELHDLWIIKKELREQIKILNNKIVKDDNNDRNF